MINNISNRKGKQTTRDTSNTKSNKKAISSLVKSSLDPDMVRTQISNRQKEILMQQLPKNQQLNQQTGGATSLHDSLRRILQASASLYGESFWLDDVAINYIISSWQSEEIMLLDSLLIKNIQTFSDHFMEIKSIALIPESTIQMISPK
ncbi:hypothetical protein PPL_04806 [Heterostelium album PN500]|uniref:Uncharacterized protein n=1 Tax=Heterostelium pallidum (strain ATCC 26659 / Pp 5 / PN500) TaxID=670386 RepID=D3B8L3_HETP5|nr:hypothetical protein PPL_04806 [Heterostelium album PN500]EFA82381.1 hypothetical protein PPL_04806 [Heterostelium album PN500]|eukprot:XP_020434498.1 hypothetical protein PPL_04806 [Heterostelium album PN500]